MVRRRERQRRYTPEFKLEAVRLMRERIAAGVTLQRVSEELEIGPDLLRVWGSGRAVRERPLPRTPRGAWLHGQHEPHGGLLG